MSGYEDKDTEIFGTNSLYNREVHIRAQKKQKKVPGLFGSYPEKPLSLHPLREKNTASGRKKTVLRNFEKKFQNLLEIRKFDLPLHPLRIRQNV